MIDDEWKQETGLISGEGAVAAAAKKLRARFGLSCVGIKNINLATVQYYTYSAYIAY